MNDCKDELKEIQQTSQKIEKISRKEGLREGISAGRDGNFQASFDKGFQEGFKNGFMLGKHKGTLLATNKQSPVEQQMHQLLEHTNRGSCELCKNIESLKDEENIEQLIGIQNDSYKANSLILNTHFEQICANGNCSNKDFG
ncbi:unnamed protein product [Phyllotreta striolata]|uniref:Essential protein Yae1 N-terminal domain-containing protein n=1 Tax=Phyllotreta striolata TaxID=444603 RepID=A0A9N9XMX0_PHYSR|nr:unnamed protein product [Phyllotreta striolata]